MEKANLNILTSSFHDFYNQCECINSCLREKRRTSEGIHIVHQTSELLSGQKLHEFH